MLKRMALTVVVALGLVTPTQAQLPVSQPIASSGSTPVAAPVEPIGVVPNAAPAAPDGPERWWFSADYAPGWIRSSGLPPLVTTSPLGTPQAAAGVLGQNTTTLFGSTNQGGDVRQGIRLALGGWFNDERTFGLDVGLSVLESQGAGFGASSSGNVILARPFTDANTGLHTSQIIAYPGVSTGSIAAALHTDNFYDFHADLEEVMLDSGGFRLASLLGYRFLRFADRLTVEETVTSLGTPVLAAGTTVAATDRFTAQNSFHGVDFGLRGEFHGDQWSVNLLAKLAVGNVHRQVGITGATRVTVPGSAPVDEGGGFLALSSNSGVFGSSDWVIAPEAAINFCWDFNSHVSLHLGYSFLYWTDVARAAQQVSTTLNPNLFPPAPVGGSLPSMPAFSLQKSDIWVQTVNLGVEIRF
jgi:hypothetical protein